MTHEETLISECLNGDRHRDCENCPAHSSKGGKCCFGALHEYGDPDCTDCAISRDCAAITHGRTATNHPPRIIYPARPPAKTPVRTSVPPGSSRYGSSAPTYQRGDSGPQLGEPLLEQRPCEPQPLQFDPDDGLFRRFLKVSVWGAGEGFFEMALNFFRKRRPE